MLVEFIYYKYNLVMRRNIFTILITCALLLSNAPANAVWKGEINQNDKRAVPFFIDPQGNACASGFLYAPRIVFTSAHSLFEGDDREVEQVKIRSAIWIGWPMDPIGTSTGSRRVQSQKIFVPKDYKGRDFARGGNRLTRLNDFAVIVLEKPLPVDDKKVELLTPDLHQQFIDSNEQVNLTGYGGQIKEHLGKPCDGRKPSSYQSVIVGKQIATGNLNWTATLNTKVAPGMPNTCDGDSGAGITKILSDRYIYLGAQGAGGWKNHNCATYEPWVMEETIMGADPVYQFNDLIKQAEEYVAANPYIEKAVKTSLVCSKGKISKTITEITPKCPKGFKIAQPKEGQTCLNFGEIIKGLTCVKLNQKFFWTRYTLSESIDGRPKIGSRCFRENLEVLGIDSESRILRTICSYRNSPGAFPAWTL